MKAKATASAVMYLNVTSGTTTQRVEGFERAWVLGQTLPKPVSIIEVGFGRKTS